MKIDNLAVKSLVYIILSCILNSCVWVGFALENKNQGPDVREAVPIPNSETTDTAFKTATVEFSFNYIYNEKDILQYDSPEPRLKYFFNIIAPVEPTVKLNSFSFTNARGDTIPSILYYRTKHRKVNIIDSLPIMFTADLVTELKMSTLTIWAECSKSEKEVNILFVNYDIMVGDKHYVKSIKYKKKLVGEIRPQIW